MTLLAHLLFIATEHVDPGSPVHKSVSAATCFGAEQAVYRAMRQQLSGQLSAGTSM